MGSTIFLFIHMYKKLRVYEYYKISYVLNNFISLTFNVLSDRLLSLDFLWVLMNVSILFYR